MVDTKKIFRMNIINLKNSLSIIKYFLNIWDYSVIRNSNKKNYWYNRVTSPSVVDYETN